MVEISELDRVFTPQYERRYADVLSKRTRLVHYTSAEAAMLILSNKCIWLRNTLFMNDASEVEYALQLLGNHFGVHNPASAQFWAAIDRVTGGRAEAVRNQFDGWTFDMSTATYICCVSEHRDEEDRVGRLSMWRAYGRPNGVAMVINPAYLALQNDALGAFSYPVEYCDEQRSKVLFDEVVSNVLTKESELAKFNPDVVYNYVFHCFQTFALGIKHPGFSEEKEWRVIYRPNYQASDLLKPKTVSIAGAPQKVFELPLVNAPDRGVERISPADLIDQIIIGPSTHAFAMWRGFVEMLQEAGVPEPEKKVHCSNIPVRQ